MQNGEWKLALSHLADVTKNTMLQNTIACSAAFRLAKELANSSLHLASGLRCRRAEYHHLHRRYHAGDKEGEWLLALAP